MATTEGKESSSLLRSWRTTHGLSLADMQDVTGVSKSYLSRLETGSRTASALTKIRIARSLGVRVNVLFELPPVAEEGDLDSVAVSGRTT